MNGRQLREAMRNQLKSKVQTGGFIRFVEVAKYYDIPRHIVLDMITDIVDHEKDWQLIDAKKVGNIIYITRFDKSGECKYCNVEKLVSKDETCRDCYDRVSN